MPLFKTSSKKEETHLDTLQELRQFQIKNPIPINESKIELSSIGYSFLKG